MMYTTQINTLLIMSPPQENKSKIILALDVNTIGRACELMDEVGVERIGVVKVGLELITAQIAGEVATCAIRRGFHVFWDGKPDDVPRTIGKAVKEAAARGVKFINVHANATVEGMMAAVANKGNAQILAVSALTSILTEEVEIEFGRSRKAQVLYYARTASYAGCDGLICSPEELQFLAKFYKRKENPEIQIERLIKVIPGTRSPGADHQDQKNVLTQEVAIANGADWLVIGSEINGAKNPAAAADALNVRIAKALEEKLKGAVAV
ncbi:MAG: orotidine 5'-phosphate decarboxylase [Candidatus Taylorbacteria bacterium RIFCSPHIGHO2_02_FULL_45_35]|uniref:Orotidine 5'-phosphate decarboxylase n=1 Tax=Candidatus Taylorbacteria bacterium RIFCSPHIGHO2_02_FULL_45_35 TaxID=1802311 RepID=A0A1G2MVJ5_9BACT|nr:MAG: orotidine 5'-phosphate decarboxylase [Candidatus Taylorbacteria bacterium RIFCSPHIGHO2_02_FULL_45_35]OHA32439.1 MAG: orotidine 5'-phosphate decarboxylase [Candidatus Taylorbacteria bacterium RIFCSPLOWO2_01_FULL_45_34b]